MFLSLSPQNDDVAGNNLSHIGEIELRVFEAINTGQTVQVNRCHFRPILPQECEKQAQKSRFFKEMTKTEAMKITKGMLRPVDAYLG